MRGHTCLSSSRRALSRVFLAPTPSLEASRALHPLSRTTNGSPRSALVTSQTRCFANTPLRTRKKVDEVEEAQAKWQAEEMVDLRYTTEAYMEKTGRDRFPWDHEITDPFIMVLEGGNLEGPLKTQFVLSKIYSNESLRMQKPYKPADKKTGKPAEYAICKVVDKGEEYKAAKALKEKKKLEAKPKTKEVEVSWSISENDLQTKMRQLGGFLEKGHKVELTLGKKKRGKAVSESDAKALLKQVRKEIGAQNAFEPKQPSGELGEVMRLGVQRKPTSSKQT